MSALPTLYQEGRKFSTHWFRLPCGKVQSYRWLAAEAGDRRAQLPVGTVEVQDPFRPGAPVGGHKHNALVAFRLPLEPITLKTDRSVR